MADNLTYTTIATHFSDEDEAYKLIERIRWPNGPICPHCGSVDHAYFLEPQEGKRTTRKGTETHRRLWKCANCRKQFSVLIGTIFEDSHLPLHKWLMAIHEMCASKNGISALELSRKLGIAYRSAWFMTHRIRHAMTQSPLANMLQGTVEADETYVGGKAKGKRGRGAANKTPVVTLVERGGEARSRTMQHVTSANVGAVLNEQVALTANLMTDSYPVYTVPGKKFASHQLLAKSFAPKEAQRHFVHEGWLLVSASGTVGRTVLATKQLEKFFLTHDLLRLVPSMYLPNGYLYAYLSSWIGQALMTKDQYGAAIKHLEPHHIATVDKGNGIPFLRPSQLPQIKPWDLGYISQRTPELEELKLNEGEVMVVTDGTVGRVGIVSSSIAGWVGSNNIARIVYGTQHKHNGYLAAFLSNPYGFYQLTRGRGIFGGVIDHIETAEYVSVLVPNAPTEIQQLIGEKVIRAYEKKDEANQVEAAAIKRLEEILAPSSERENQTMPDNKSPQEQEQDAKKHKNQPISLHPLGFEEALTALLQTPPPPKETIQPAKETPKSEPK